MAASMHCRCVSELVIYLLKDDDQFVQDHSFTNPMNRQPDINIYRTTLDNHTDITMDCVGGQ